MHRVQDLGRGLREHRHLRRVGAGAAPTRRHRCDRTVRSSTQRVDETAGQRYDRLVAPFARSYTHLTLRELAVPEQGVVVDHGAGTGEATLEIHRRHPTVSVTALDVDAALLSHLRAKAGRNATWLTVVIGTVDTLPARMTADVVVSQLVLSLTADPSHELRALRAHTAPGGMLRAAVLGGPERMRAFAGYWNAAHAVVPGAAPASVYPHLRFADPGALRDIAAAAGWRQCRVEAADTTRTGDAALLWEWLSRTLPLYDATGQLIPGGTLDESTREALRGATVEQLAPYRTSDDRYVVPTGGWLLTATA